MLSANIRLPCGGKPYVAKMTLEIESNNIKKVICEIFFKV
jgi:hypothetical protein